MDIANSSPATAPDLSDAHTGKPRINKYVLCCALLASVTSVLLGYDIGVMSGAIIFIQKDLKLTDVQIEILTGILSLYSLIGSFAAGRISDYIGRRYTIAISGLFFLSGSLFMGLAPNYTFLMIGRFIAGIGVGFGLVIASCYTAELSPASSRGQLTSLTEIFINVGILLGYLSNLSFAKLPLNLGWRLMLGVGIVPSLFIIFGILLMPESPRWLVLQGRLKDAKNVLEMISNSTEEAASRLTDMKSAVGITEACVDDIVSVPKHQSNGTGVYKELLFKPTRPVRHIVIALLGINFFQQAIGADAVVLYSPRIFSKAGITSNHKQLLCTVAVGLMKLLFILIATFTVDRLGRRPLLLTTMSVLFLSLILLATGLTVVNESSATPVWAIALCITAVLTFVASFSVGLGPVLWVYCAEIVPLRLRAQGMALGVAVNRLLSGIISMTFLSLSKALTIGGAFFMFAGISALAWVFVYLMMPETRGRKLEDMEKVFGDLKWKKKEIQMAYGDKADEN